jgi:hypothetical protein
MNCPNCGQVLPTGATSCGSCGWRQPAQSPPLTGGAAIGASLFVILGFFMPWLRACGFEFSGFDLATNSTGSVENSQLYWIPLLAGLVGLVVGIALLRAMAENARSLGIVALGASLLGILCLIALFAQIYSQVEPEYRAFYQVLPGAVLTLMGLLGLCGAGLWAITSSTARTASTTSIGPTPGTVGPSPPLPPTRRCSECGAEVPETSRFCGKCGAEFQVPVPVVASEAPVTVTCPECKTTNPQRNKFCSRCGASLAGAMRA